MNINIVRATDSLVIPPLTDTPVAIAEIKETYSATLPLLIDTSNLPSTYRSSIVK